MTSPDIVLVVAVAENGVIGVNGGLPWRIRADLRRFRAVTIGKPVIMGRSTFESIGRPLDGRDNIVLTRQPGFQAEGVIVAGNLARALEIAAERAQARDVSELCAIGGAAVFAETLPLAARMHVTHVAGEPAGDVVFPAISHTEWKAVAREALPAHEQDTAQGTYVLYERRT